MLGIDIARSTEHPAEPGSASHAPGKQTLTSSLSLARAPQGAASAGASFGASRTADPFWFAADATFAVGEAASASGPAGPAGQPGASLIVEDGGPVAPNQMTKSEFLTEVHRLMPGEDVAPWRSRPSAALEQDVRKRVPGAASAHSARDYLASIAAHAQNHAAAGTGPKTPGVGALAAIGGSEHAAADYMRSGAMGEGAALSSGTRAAMESVFHHDFGAVRVHTGHDAQALAGQLHARAFTVGHQVAFGAGNYAPGTPVGDALLAHELAHVVQQNGAQSFGRGDSGALDADADQAAGYAVSALHGGELSARAPARPALRSGVGLQRCPGGGGGGGGALTFSSASYSPGSGGASTATPNPASLYVTTSGYISTGSVSASGGTDADAAAWDIGYLQLVRSTSRKGHYVGSPAATTYNINLPANTRDGINGTTAPWYNSSSPGMKAFTKTSSTESVQLGDQPQGPFPWDTPDGKGKLSHVDGKDSFTSWMIVRKRAAPNTIQFINWETWEAGFATTTNYASAGAKTVAAVTGTTKNTGSGAGQGSDSPNLTGGMANTIVTATWT